MPTETVPTESVWDYPRPPQVDECSKHIRIMFNGVVLAVTRRAMRLLETSHPPVYYIPPEDIRMESLSRTPRTSDIRGPFKGEPGTQPMLRALQMAGLEASSLPGTQGW